MRSLELPWRCRRRGMRPLCTTQGSAYFMSKTAISDDSLLFSSLLSSSLLFSPLPSSPLLSSSPRTRREISPPIILRGRSAYTATAGEQSSRIQNCVKCVQNCKYLRVCISSRSTRQKCAAAGWRQIRNNVDPNVHSSSAIRRWSYAISIFELSLFDLKVTCNNYKFNHMTRPQSGQVWTKVHQIIEKFESLDDENQRYKPRKYSLFVPDTSTGFDGKKRGLRASKMRAPLLYQA